MKWIKASEQDFDSSIGDKHWRANGKAISAGMAFMLFKKKTGDDIEVLDESPSPSDREGLLKASNDYLRKECNSYLAEIERLNGLIKEGFVLINKGWGKDKLLIEKDWNKFKQQNNL